MLAALAAERFKLLRHRATWGLVWIFPIGVVLLFALGVLLQQTRGGHHGGAGSAADWIAQSAIFWKGVASGPARFLIGAFAALAFGSEYGWNTWKLIAPHSRRPVLIAAKFVTVTGLAAAAFILMSFLAVALSAAYDAATHQLPQGIALSALLSTHAKAALSAVPGLLLTIGFGAAFAVLLRSSMAGTVAAVAAVILDGVAWQFSPILKRELFLALPSYHVRNLAEWISTGHVLTRMMLKAPPVAWDWSASLGVVALWIAVLWGAAFLIFQRQDLN